MKIIGTPINKVINIYEVNRKQTQKNQKISKKDTIEISKTGKQLSSFAEKEFSPISSEKIEKIKNQISEGTYKVDHKALAEKMLMKGRK